MTRREKKIRSLHDEIRRMKWERDANSESTGRPTHWKPLEEVIASCSWFWYWHDSEDQEQAPEQLVA